MNENSVSIYFDGLSDDHLFCTLNNMACIPLNGVME